MAKTTAEKLQEVENSMAPLVTALDDYLSDTDETESQDQPAIRNEASNLYSNLKGFLGTLQIHKILGEADEDLR